ncbi:MAG: hypothetical protein K2J47_00840, partial [Ruminococcus sp.]|nr:hypothetical protein [Ruminococcus sp.]
MKKSERETLKKAFNIPEPEQKESFILLYNEKLKKNERKFNLPVFFRYASTAVFAVLIIGLWGNLSKTADFRDKFNIDEPTTAITSQTTAVTQLTETNNITTSNALTMQITQTATENSVHTDSATGSAVNSVHIHQQVTMPDLPDFTPSVTAITFPTRTQPSATSKVISATTARKTTAVKYTTTAIIATDEEPSYSYDPSLTVTAVPMTTVTDNSPVPPNKNDATTYPPLDVDIPPVTVPKPIVTTESKEDNVPSLIGRDYTVYPSKVYNKSENIINMEDTNDFDHTTAVDSTVSVDMLKNYSDYIILGRIDNIIYTQVKGKPYTQENITVYQVYKGDKLHEYDKISIYIPGGYMPVSEFEILNNKVIDAPDNYYIYDS